MAAIEVQGLTKTFRTYKKEPGIAGALRGLVSRRFEYTTAVRDVAFSIESGELVGFLGANGAGKTTTLKMLAGLLYPTSGSARVLGHVPWKREDGYRCQFALLLGQKNQLWWDLPARESLELNAKIYGIDAISFQRTVDELTELLLVREKLNVMVRELSLGERMKMELIAALLHQPKVLFLDEPTNGVDPASRRDFWRILYQLLRERVTIFVSTAYLDEAERANRVALMHKGKLLAVGTPEELKKLMRGSLLEVRTDEPRRATALLRNSLAQDSVGLFGDKVHILTNRGEEATRQAEKALRVAGLESSSIRSIEPTLEDVFVSVLGNDEGGGA